MTAETRRAELLDGLADHVLAQGLRRSTLRALAAEVGTSDRMLLYYFEDRGTLISSVLTHVAWRLMGELAAREVPAPVPYAVLREALMDAVEDAELWPYLRLWLEMASEAARGDALCREVGRQIGEGVLTWCADQLAGEGAEHLMLEVEGAVVLKALGLEAITARAVPPANG